MLGALTGVCVRMAFDRSSPVERARAGAPRPLLPALIANTLVDAARLMTGSLILICVAAAWASLMSWSLADPSLSHATSLPARNWLGAPGAIAADLMIQTFGIAVLAMLLPPLFWGLALVQREPVPGAAGRIGAWAIMIATTAMAAASLPSLANWPLYHGLGGIIGDAGMRLAAAPFMAASAEFGRPAAGAVMGAIALWCGAHAIGLSWLLLSRTGSDIRRLLTTARTRPNRTRSRSPTTAASANPPGTRIEPTLGPLLQPVFDRADTAAPAAAAPRTRQPDRTAPALQTVRTASQFGPYAALELEAEPDPAGDDFDAWTQAASSGIAARFAPASNGPHVLQETLIDAFTGPPRQVADAQSGEPAEPAGAYTVLPPDTPSLPETRTAHRTGVYKRPSLNLLERPRTVRPEAAFAASLLRGNARLLEDVLAEFGVIGEVCDIKSGPVVTLYEFEPARGTNPARVIGLAQDIARAMGVPPVRISPITGRSALAIELPREGRETVYLRDVFDAEAYRSSMDALPVALGKTVTGQAVVADLARMPNMLLAGAAGAGTSSGINAMILSLVYKHGPENCRFLMIDPNMVELSVFDGIPHLLTPVVSDPHKAITALAWCVREMEERYKRMATLGVRSIDVYNNRVRNAAKRGDRLARTVQTGFDDKTGRAKFEKEEMTLEPMPYIVIVIEEFADLMAVAGPQIEGSVKRLADAARAAGIHLIMATERPSSDIVTGPIREAVPSRVAYKVASRVDSRMVLGVEGAEQLLGHGDMLYATGAGQPVRVHGAYVSAEEVETIADSLRQQGSANYVEGITGDDPAVTGRPDALRSVREQTSSPRTQVSQRAAVSEDGLYDRAVAIVVRDGRASAGQLQRRLNIQPAWAQALIVRLQAGGIIAAADANGHHAVLVGAAA